MELSGSFEVSLDQRTEPTELTGANQLGLERLRRCSLTRILGHPVDYGRWVRLG